MEVDREMTWEEIENEFDGEWVLINDPETDSQLNVLRGRVRYHCEDRDEFDVAARRLGAKRSARYFVGRMKADVQILL